MLIKNLSREDVSKAMQYVKETHIQAWEQIDSYEPRKYDLYFDGYLYSPSLIIYYAYGLAYREELIPAPDCFAEVEANQLLINLGFEILERKAKRNLIKYETYNREEIHDIFDPYTVFFSGSWGMHRMIKIPDREHDYVFLVTLGIKSHLSEDGILTWQSPNKLFKNEHIQNLINHNHLIDNIYLFLTNNSKPPFKFVYLGRLAYVSHDIEMENPVYFKWQILDWDVSNDILEAIGLKLINPRVNPPEEHVQIVESNPPEKQSIILRGACSERFNSQNINFAECEVKNRELGLKGELFVLEYEKQTLAKAGYHHLAEHILHTAYIEGDGAGYDIKSITTDRNVKYIEVKTTKGGKTTPFMISSNEVAFSKRYAANYYLYRVFDFNKDTGRGKFYIIHGDVSKQFDLEATQYRAKR